MKKVQIVIVMFLVSSMALFSFSNKATKYGGSASVKINVIEVYSPTIGDPSRKILSSPTLNATESCIYSSSSEVKGELKSSLELEADSKASKARTSFKAFTTYEWEYAGSIDYRVSSCD